MAILSISKPLMPDYRVPRGEGKFRLVKFFAWASFIVIVILTFPFSMVISQQAKETLLMSYENSAKLLGNNLNHQVFQNFVIPAINRYGIIKLSDAEQSELMDRVVRNTTHGFNVDVVNVYDIAKGLVAYSTDSKLFGVKALESEGYKKAMVGESSSSITSSRYDLWGLGIDLLGGERKIRTYVPFRGIDPYTWQGYVGGVFELIQDISEEYQAIVKLQYLIFGLTILIMGIIFVALLLIVHKAEKMIDERSKAQRDLEAQLHQAERLATLGEMVASVSHEIKNPLGIIRSTAELLGGMQNTTDAQRQLSSVITEESTRLNRIVTEFLDFARPQIPNLGRCDLKDILEKNLLLLRPELEKREVTVRHNLNGRSLTLMADHGLLYRAFLNILINASQAVSQGGRIDVTVLESSQNYFVEIEDSGSGIDPENVDRIFNPFFTTKEKGSGLGLAIVKKIIEGHGGSIHIESAAGKGTKVKISLPLQGT
ncbi:MAG: GHKL domain-containing protein [Deltaproteobacteria bacterium]|nr:GHKL domain-containing protein [Deltaproteobacteria bacterium]